ncbi:endonuclease/exonuclease/phosphatase family protein [Mycobacterium sp. ITM-2016-00317]|uniref:endonuclease/exonuclease/phosphatase family protein n=1 Tax=Mycobacterium sp. ITM-2016-00317 TaxID=2099694 RepID=UPI00287F9517|nr:endonuclease/exonuclease/phosphatase family protein [Mycobacterium sp. ITM-2016-00317]WNG88507.1 endonuclease/exonuclease/phosphatase family protein [Mycobacterium sp. ITM-2016-00317]
MPTRSGLTVATWNTNWATLRADRGRRVAARLSGLDADIIVVTEGTHEVLPAGGYSVDAGTDWGYANQPTDRRKVIVWSRFPVSLQSVGNRGGSLGRLVVTNVATPAGVWRVIGVCIPWSAAHVSTGRCDARPWSEHLDHLDHLELLLTGLDDGVPTVVAGDFNQRTPRVQQPMIVADRIGAVFRNWSVHTAGKLEHGPLIDHIVTNSQLRCTSIKTWPGQDASGSLSDHSAVRCEFTLSTERTRDSVTGEFTDDDALSLVQDPVGGDIDGVAKSSPDGHHEDIPPAAGGDADLVRSRVIGSSAGAVKPPTRPTKIRTDFRQKPSDWTRDEFVGSVGASEDRGFLSRLLELVDADALLPALGPAPRLYFGTRGGGAMFVYPRGRRFPPYKFLSRNGRLMIAGCWRGGFGTAGDPGYAAIASLLGQQHTGPARSIAVAEFDPAEVWRIGEDVSRAVNDSIGS